jgi:hypothetical protein
MKKTAVQEVFNELEKLHPNFFDIYTEKGRQFVHHFHKFLEIEKSQMINFFTYGCMTQSNNLTSEEILKQFRTYYDKQFKDA